MTSAFGVFSRQPETRVLAMRTERAGGRGIANNMRRGLAAAGLTSAVLCSIVVVSGPALAQEPRGNEGPIGTFTLGPSTLAPSTPGASPLGPSPLGAGHDGFSIVEPPAGVPARKRDNADDGSGRWFFQGWDLSPARDTSAESLYSDAMLALDGGRHDVAQRLFERLIAEAPNSPRAEAARQHLGQIYRGVDPAGRARPAETQAAGADGGASSFGVSKAVSRAALHQARVAPAIDGEFLSDAGDRVFFSAGSADLGVRARGVIQSQARFLLRYPELFAAIEGHADDGSTADAESLRLSDERAAAVRDRLIAEGVDSVRILAYGRGREDRVSDCPAPDCLAQNRRAVTILLDRSIEPEARPARRAQGNAPAPATASPTQ
jgi:peptidoglycan-associated lipoprotein